MGRYRVVSGGSFIASRERRSALGGMVRGSFVLTLKCSNFLQGKYIHVFIKQSYPSCSVGALESDLGCTLSSLLTSCVIVSE